MSNAYIRWLDCVYYCTSILLSSTIFTLLSHTHFYHTSPVGVYDLSAMYAESSLTMWLIPHNDAYYYDDDYSFIPAGEIFYILIERENGLSTYCGRPGNYEGFTVSVQSRNTTLVVPDGRLVESDPIGPGCKQAVNSSSK